MNTPLGRIQYIAVKPVPYEGPCPVCGGQVDAGDCKKCGCQLFTAPSSGFVDEASPLTDEQVEAYRKATDHLGEPLMRGVRRRLAPGPGIDPAQEVAERMADIDAQLCHGTMTAMQVAAERGADWRTATVDMVCPPDEIKVLVPQGDHFADYAAMMARNIAANLGIPTEVITAAPMSSGYSEARVHMQMFRDRMEEWTAAIREQFRPAINALHKAFVQFSAAAFTMACILYREKVGRLPGSNRTARLRKKRRTRVLAWYCDVYLPSLVEDRK